MKPHSAATASWSSVPAQWTGSLWRRLRFEHERRCRESLFNRYLHLGARDRAWRMAQASRQGLTSPISSDLAYGGLLEAIDRYDSLRGIPDAMRAGAFAAPSLTARTAPARAARNIAAGDGCSDRTRQCPLRNGADNSADPIGELPIRRGVRHRTHCRKNLTGGPQRDPVNGYDTLPWLAFQRDIFRCIDDLPEAEKAVLEPIPQ